jgi:hypothetical protein
VLAPQPTGVTGSGKNYWPDTDQNVTTGNRVFGAAANVDAEYCDSIARYAMKSTGVIEPMIYDTSGNYSGHATTRLDEFIVTSTRRVWAEYTHGVTPKNVT